ncbi:MAG: hypothetical protein JW751_02200 [Polyangiaceae bacterium]|nr:hypothetical protein [Polyangiaceae bacterium]
MPRTSRTLLTISLLLVGAVACAKTGDQAFRARAAQDLNCPVGDLFIEHKWEGSEASKRASGCGREAFYVRECEHEGCLWKIQAGSGTAATTASSTGTATAQ